MRWTAVAAADVMPMPLSAPPNRAAMSFSSVSMAFHATFSAAVEYRSNGDMRSARSVMATSLPFWVPKKDALSNWSFSVSGGTPSSRVTAGLRSANAVYTNPRVPGTFFARTYAPSWEMTGWLRRFWMMLRRTRVLTTAANLASRLTPDGFGLNAAPATPAAVVPASDGGMGWT